MTLLKNRTFAVIVTALLCFIFAVCGFNRTVASLTDDCTAGFYEGVDADGYTSGSIYSALESCVKHSLTLASVYADCDALDEGVSALRADRNELIEAMDARDIPAMSSASRKLISDAQSLQDSAGAVAGEADISKGTDAYAKLSSAYASIANNPYNDTVDAFETQVLGTAPAKLLSFALFTDTPPRFE